MWDPPRPGLEPVSPALAGGLSTTAPPGKPLFLFILTKSLCLCETYSTTIHVFSDLRTLRFGRSWGSLITVKGLFLSRIQFNKDSLHPLPAILIEKNCFSVVLAFLVITVGPQVFHIRHPNWKQKFDKRYKDFKRSDWPWNIAKITKTSYVKTTLSSY